MNTTSTGHGVYHKGGGISQGWIWTQTSDFTSSEADCQSSKNGSQVSEVEPLQHERGT